MCLVSILVPVYNVEKYFYRCLVSLFEQDFESIEYVFVNDASQDSSMEILKNVIDKYPKRKKYVKIVNHSRNMGLAVARRTAVQHASSDYIVHIDSDDCIDVDMISKMYELVTHNNCDIVLSNTLIEYKNCKLNFSAENVIDKFSYLSDLLTRKSIFTIWGKLLKKSIIIDNNLYAEAGINNGEDYQVYPRIVYYANVIGSVNATYYYNKCNQSSYTNSISHKGINDIIISQRILNTFFLTDNRIDISIVEASSMMTIISLLSVSPLNEYSFIFSSFTKIDYRNSHISLSYRILLFLMQFKFYRLSYMLVSLYKYFFHKKRR